MSIKYLVKKIPGAVSFYNKVIHLKFLAYLSKQKTLKERFTSIYRDNVWTTDDSVSGPGSTLTYTENIRNQIPIIVENYHIKIILDAPCGDYNWFRYIQLPNDIKYIGVDIVEEIIENNVLKFKRPNVNFHVKDITKDDLPDADLWFCRDCLFHLNNKQIIYIINKLKMSNMKFFMSSTHPDCLKNKNIISGDFRQINLEKSPFNLPKPILYIDDWIEGFPKRKIGLWSIEQIKICAIW